MSNLAGQKNFSFKVESKKRSKKWRLDRKLRTSAGTEDKIKGHAYA